MAEYEDYSQDPKPDKNPDEIPVEILAEALSEDALNGVIDNFIQREGTDYGQNEVSHETKVQQIRRQLDRGDIKIIFDASTETVSLLTRREWDKLRK